MDIQLVSECLGFRTTLAMVGVAIVDCACSGVPARQWAHSILVAAITALAANMVRIQVLYWIGHAAPALFHVAHDMLGYVAMGLALGLWMRLTTKEKGEK